MTSPRGWPVAIIGSGNIGTDLMIKIMRSDGPLRLAAMVGIDPDSDGLARANRLGVADHRRQASTGCWRCQTSTTSGWSSTPPRPARTGPLGQAAHTGVRMLDLTPASIGPFCVPVVNLEDHMTRRTSTW